MTRSTLLSGVLCLAACGFEAQPVHTKGGHCWTAQPQLTGRLQEDLVGTWQTHTAAADVLELDGSGRARLWSALDLQLIATGRFSVYGPVLTLTFDGAGPIESRPELLVGGGGQACVRQGLIASVPFDGEHLGRGENQGVLFDRVECDAQPVEPVIAVAPAQMERPAGMPAASGEPERMTPLTASTP